jgi:2-succinyl-6-hydroxy-2,4-cyclohexadiene-1-carboxylate synthase
MLDHRPYLLFIHGFMGSAGEFETLAARSFHDYSYGCFSLPGHNDAPLDPHMTWKTVADAIMRYLDKKGVAQAVLVGYSMGGRMALGMAHLHPGRVAGLVLTSVNPGLASDEARQQRLTADQQLAQRLKESDFGVFLADWYAQPLFGSLQSKSVYQDVLVHRQAQNPQTLAQAAVQLSIAHHPDFRPIAGRLQKPVLLLTGGADKKAVGLAKDWQSKWPSLRWVSMPHAGHAVYVEQPNTWAMAIRDFLCNQR